MIWPVNYSLYAAATMFTIFFAGNVFAPNLKIGSESSLSPESAQDFFQNRYIAAFRHCYNRLKSCKAIKGWGIMNEPHTGFIGYRDLRTLENVTLALGPVQSPFQAMLAASGRTVKVPVYTPWLKGSKVIGKKSINPMKLSLFRDGFCCPWKQEGIWSEDGSLLKPDHFSKYQGRQIRFTDDFFKPFTLNFMRELEKVKPTLFFLEGIPHGENLSWSAKEPQNVVNAFHHYDGFTLFTKSFRPWLTLDPKTGRIILGRKNTASFYSAKLAEASAWARSRMGNMPSFLGEFGLPFDLGRKKAYRTGNYKKHEEALSLYYDGIDENLLGSTIWNYSSDNTHGSGDQWNGEDLSIVSESGPRAMAGWRRPYPMATAGIPLGFKWDRKKGIFSFRFKAEAQLASPTEIYIPAVDGKEKPEIYVKGPGKDLLKTELRPEEQRLFVYNSGFSGEAEISVTLRQGE
jgi:hypothetical protein